ncbi:MAG TPA: hypothetical protein VLG49_04140 [Rhabdochlamydiaceae bacterium]|nr:hypothetical protein [Rhabdochlamydiaceae bacterium]
MIQKSTLGCAGATDLQPPASDLCLHMPCFGTGKACCKSVAPAAPALPKGRFLNHLRYNIP